MVRLRFFDDPARFLDRADRLLAEQSLVGTVLATSTERAVRDDAAGVPLRQGVPRWWVLVCDADRADRVVSAAMRTAPFAPYPMYVLQMPPAAAVELARWLHERGEHLPAVNGALPAAQLLAEETARLTGGSVGVALHSRLFELTAPGWRGRPRDRPPRPAGRLRAADARDTELLTDWYAVFHDEADAQAGRSPSGSEAPTRGEVVRRLAEGRTWLWENESGEIVHLTGATLPSRGVSRIGPVYTPVGHRGNGYASWVVAEVAGRLTELGERVSLFTDQANPTSNGIYQRIGFMPVVDMANLVVIADPL